MFLLHCIVLELNCTVWYCKVLRGTLRYSTVFNCASTVLYFTVLYCTVLYCTVLYFTVLYCTVLYCIVLYFTVLYCNVMYCTVLYCTVLYCTVLYCNVFYNFQDNDTMYHHTEYIFKITNVIFLKFKFPILKFYRNCEI